MGKRFHANEGLRYLESRLATDLAFLSTLYGLTTVTTQEAAGGRVALVIMSNRTVEVQIYSEDHKVFVKIRAVTDPDQQNWFGLGLVRQLLTGVNAKTAALDDDQIEFLKSQQELICAAFSAGRRVESARKLWQLEAETAMQRYGLR